MDKYLSIEDRKNPGAYFVLRTQFPQFLFKLVSYPGEKTKSVTVHRATYNIQIVRDYNNYGDLPETYLKELARFCFSNGSVDQNLTVQDVESLPVSSGIIDFNSISPWFNTDFISQNCFAKDPEWFRQRINGEVINGKVVTFDPTQKEELADYLKLKAQELLDLANKVSYVSPYDQALAMAHEEVKLEPHENKICSVEIKVGGIDYFFHFSSQYNYYEKKFEWITNNEYEPFNVIR